MSLPDLIEIVPLEKAVRAEITVPGSKSITNRALVLAALAEGETTLQGALWSEDTQVMVEGLQELGFMVNVAADPDETCNRMITVYGLSGKVPRGGTPEQPLELYVGNAGTASRFLAAMVCLGEGVYKLHGVARMHERPQAELFKALRDLGYRIDSPNDKLPALVHGSRPRAGKCQVSIEESSQFASALLLCARAGGWKIEVVGENTEESPYVEMTKQLCNVFPSRGGLFEIEPDASSGSYFWAADWVLWISHRENPDVMEPHEMGNITIKHWPKSGWQVDAEYPRYRNFKLSEPISRKLHVADSIMTAIVTAPLNPRAYPAGELYQDSTLASAWEPVKFTDLGRLRLQECDRVFALKEQLKKCGAEVTERGDTLEVFPSELHGAEIETYHDHRMAMCFAILGLKVPGIKIKNPACVKKTFPNFFQKLAAPPPRGLGVTILEVRTRRELGLDELFAE